MTSLSVEQVEFFRENGYLALDRFLPDEDVAMLRAAYDRIFSVNAGRDEGDQFDLGGADKEGETAVLPQILRPSKYAPEMEQSSALALATAVAKQLLGEKAQAFIDHAILKPPKIGAATPWHQDAGYWDSTVLHHAISIWIPLQPVNEENGCMQFVPGSHEFDVVEHEPINNDPSIHGLQLAQTAMRYVKDVKVCPLPAGGCTIHDGYTLHYTAPNRSDGPRRALILGGRIPPVKRVKPRRYSWIEIQKTARMERAGTMEPTFSDARPVVRGT